jgi:glycosyltransferase involved in cell wall biosynthesis
MGSEGQRAAAGAAGRPTEVAGMAIPAPAASPGSLPVAAGASGKKLTILTPCFNEEGGIAECYERVRDVMTGLPGYAYEHLFIDNASTDRTVAILKEIAARDRRVKLIVNSRNFGHTRSPHHGMLQMTGDAFIPVLADLQTPAELIPAFVAKWEQGFKMVVAVRRSMQEGFFLRLARHAFYRLIARLSHIEQIRNFMGYGLYDRSVVDIIGRLGEPDPYFRGLVSEIGFEKAFVEYDQPARKHGRSRHSLFDLVEMAMLGITTYSKVPLRLMTVTGITIALVSLVAGFGYLIAKLIFWNTFSAGIAPILLATLFFASVQLIAIGMVGEYIGLILQYVRRFPLVVEKERVNFD